MRQKFDEVTKCVESDHGENCGCSSDQFIRLFCLLEERGLVVTSDEWKAKMRSILEKHPKYAAKEPCEGNSCSVVALVKQLRNLFAHKDPADMEYALFRDICQTFYWIAMHCFSFWTNNVLEDQPILCAFSAEFQQIQKKNLHNQLSSGSLEKPVEAIFVVQVTDKNDLCKKTIFFKNIGKTVEEIQKETHQRIGIPKRKKVAYMGTFDPLATSLPSKAVGKVLQSSEFLNTLDLDTLKPHLFRIDEEQVCLHVKIQCGGAETEIQMRFWPDDKFEVVNDWVSDLAGEELELFKDRRPIKKSATVGSFCFDDYEILAMDSDARTKFFARFSTEIDDRSPFMM